MKFLCLIVIFSTTLHCNHAQEEKVFRMIFAVNKFVLSTKLDDFIKIFREFKRDVTSMAIYNNYLFVSLERSNPNNPQSKYSKIWRVNITDLKSMEIDYSSWNRFHAMNNYSVDIKCMVAAKGYIFVGLSDGTIARCSVEKKNSCETFWTKNIFSVTGIDYNPNNGKIYASFASGRLVHCLVDTVDSCRYVNYPGFDAISAIKVESDAIWLGVRKTYEVAERNNYKREFTESRLVKCPTSTSFLDFECQIFRINPDSDILIRSIGTLNGNVYFNFWKSKEIWTCSSKDNSSCSHLNPKIGEDVDTFIVV